MFEDALEGLSRDDSQLLNRALDRWRASSSARPRQVAENIRAETALEADRFRDLLEDFCAELKAASGRAGRRLDDGVSPPQVGRRARFGSGSDPTWAGPAD